MICRAAAITRFRPSACRAGFRRRSETGSQMNPFDGISILLLEDEYLIALDAEQILTDLGTGRVEIVNTLEGATAAAENGGFDIAVLDLNINGKMSYGVAEILQRQRIPVVFATGYEMRSRQAP